MLKGVVALKGKQNVGKSTEIKHLCLQWLTSGAVTVVCPKTVPYAKLKTFKGEANLVVVYKGKRIGIRGAGDSQRIIKTAFAYFEKHQCEFAIMAVRSNCDPKKLTAAEIAFSSVVSKSSLRVKPILKPAQGDLEIPKMEAALQALLTGK